MIEKGKTKQLFLTELDGAKEEKFNFKVEEKDILLDLKSLMKEYYFASFTQEENALQISFNNNQRFKIVVEESL